MNHVGPLEFVWLRLRRLPRSVWIAGGLAMLILPALLLWLILSMFGGIWQVGSAWLGQGQDAWKSALPATAQQLVQEMPNAEAALAALHNQAQQRVQGEVERLRASVPASAEALQQDLVDGVLPAAAGLRELTQQGQTSARQTLSSWLPPARPSTDVSGEDPPGITRLPGFVRTAFMREGDRLQVSWVGAAPHSEVIDFYTAQLSTAGYEPKVLAADAKSTTIEFDSKQRKLLLAVREDGRGGSELDWDVR